MRKFFVLNVRKYTSERSRFMDPLCTGTTQVLGDTVPLPTRGGGGVLVGGGAPPEWALVENTNPSSDLENVSQGCYRFVHQLETNSVNIFQNPFSMVS